MKAQRLLAKGTWPLIITAVIMAVIVTAVVTGARLSPECCYRGKSLRFWLKGWYPYPVRMRSTIAMRQWALQRRAAEAAVRALGTNAVPALIEMLRIPFEMNTNLHFKLYVSAALRASLFLIAAPALMVLAIAVLKLPIWVIGVGEAAVFAAALVMASSPLMFLLRNAKEVFTESIPAQLVFVGASMLFWALLWGTTKLLPTHQPPSLFFALLPVGVFGFAWINVSGLLLMLNVAGFVLAVGRKLRRSSRCAWYVLVVSLPIIGITSYVHHSGNGNKGTWIFSGVALTMAAWLGLRDFSLHPPISKPSRYDPAAAVVARLFGGASP